MPCRARRLACRVLEMKSVATATRATATASSVQLCDIEDHDLPFLAGRLNIPFIPPVPLSSSSKLSPTSPGSGSSGCPPSECFARLTVDRAPCKVPTARRRQEEWGRGRCASAARSRPALPSSDRVESFGPVYSCSFSRSLRQRQGSRRLTRGLLGDSPRAAQFRQPTPCKLNGNGPPSEPWR